MRFPALGTLALTLAFADSIRFLFLLRAKRALKILPLSFSNNPFTSITTIIIFVIYVYEHIKKK